MPKYPQAAIKKRVEGAVRMHVLLDQSGQVLALEVIDGAPELRGAALDAVRQWKFKPYLLNGEPVELDSQITVNFELSSK